MKKRIVSALLVCVLGMSLVTGCGNNAKAAETTKTADGKIQLDLWYSGGKTAVNVFQDIVDAFNESQDKYEVKTTTQADYTETYEKLQAGIAGKKAPDMALLDTDKSRNLSEKNLVADINEYVEKDDSFEKDDYLPVFYEQGEDENGKLFALPAYGTTQVMYYNKAAFEKAGIDPATIKTWQDLAAAAEKMTASDGSFVGWEPMWGSGNLIDAALSNGASLLSEDGKKVMINSDEWVEVWESFRTWIHDDKIMKVNSGGQGWEYWYKTIDDVIQNKAGGYTGSSGDQADLDFSVVGAIEQPAWKNGTESKPVARALILSILAKSSEEKQAGAYDFMKYFTNVENQVKWSMSTGYVPVNKGVLNDDDYMKYTNENPQALVPYNQAEHGSIYPYDPTNGVVKDALKIAADKVEIDGVPAKEALDEAQKTAQKALDEVLTDKK